MVTLSTEIGPDDSQFDLLISASDQGGLKGYCHVHIDVKDVNTAPRFLEHPFSIHIPENTPVGSNVIQIRAVDNDKLLNAKLSFFLGNFILYSIFYFKL